MNEIPFDTWTEIPDEELAKKGRTQWIYRPSNYQGSLASDGYIRKESSMITDIGQIARIWISKEEAKEIFFKGYGS